MSAEIHSGFKNSNHGSLFSRFQSGSAPSLPLQESADTVPRTSPPPSCYWTSCSACAGSPSPSPGRSRRRFPRPLWPPANKASRALSFPPLTKQKTKRKSRARGDLVALLQVFHQHGHHHVHQHKLGHEHEGDKVEWGHQGQVGEAVAVLFVALPQRVLWKRGRWERASEPGCIMQGRAGSRSWWRISRKLKVLSHMKHPF